MDAVKALGVNYGFDASAKFVAAWSAKLNKDSEGPRRLFAEVIRQRMAAAAAEGKPEVTCAWLTAHSGVGLHDLIGVCWGNHFNIGAHIPGNFWMARGDYLVTLPEIDDHLQAAEAWLELPEIKRYPFLDLRHAAENWVGQNAPKVHDCAHEAAPIWDYDYWVRNPELQKYVARHGTQ
jgi:hypothetical protein